MTNPLVLSTKKLRFHQLERLMAAQCDVVDYDALQIEIQPFSIPKKPNYWVFSSQNAVRSFLANPTASAHQSPILCVGCLLYTSPSPRDMRRSRMPSSA